jgi:hypothetical protein
LHIVGGCDWIGHAATRRVTVVDLKHAPAPQNCFYEERPVFDQWSRSFNGAVPFPNMLEPLKDNPWKQDISLVFQSLLEDKTAKQT